MRNSLFYFLLPILLIVGSCKGDKVVTEEITEESVEEIAADILEQELAIAEETEEETPAEGAVTNEVEFEMEKVTVDVEKQKAEKKAILKEQLKESPNLGKDCDSLLKEYTELVDKYIKGTDQAEILKRLEGWANDPIFNKCKKSVEYRDRFFELEEKMYADEDEDL